MEHTLGSAALYTKAVNGTRDESVPTAADVEERLSEIWRRALELNQIGRQDDFFKSGGDSLSAAQVVVEIKKLFGRSLPLTVLSDLVLKVVYVQGTVIGQENAAQIRLSFPIVDEALRFLKDQRLLEVAMALVLDQR